MFSLFAFSGIWFKLNYISYVLNSNCITFYDYIASHNVIVFFSAWKMNTQVKNENSTQKLTRLGRAKLKEQNHIMDMSRVSSWHWSHEDFSAAMNLILERPKIIRKGEYLSDTPGKEVWRFTLPKGLGSTTIIYKYYDYTRFSYWERIHKSLAVREALNFAALKEIGIPVSDVLACGENRHVGFLRGAFIISKCINDSFDGSLLTPSGNMWERTKLRMGFCRNAMEQIARAHQCGCYHSAFRAHKILFPKDCDENNPALTWIDVANCQFFPNIPMKLVIPKDLVRLFVDLRMSSTEIKELCEHYLNFNPNCGFTVTTLWNAMVNLKN